MALSGLVLALFVLGHMIGNLQIFLPPEAINVYAYFLHHILPVEVLWVVRLGLLAAVAVHIWMAVLLKIENKAARPEEYDVNKWVRAAPAARYMIWSGIILLSFIIFHLLHLTVQNVHPEYQALRYMLGDKDTQDVYAMLIYGFSSKFWYIPAFYIVSMVMLAWHLSHGVSSMFQSLGWRNEVWRGRLDKIAIAYGVIVFLGFAAIPASVLLSEKTDLNLLPAKEVLSQIEEAGWPESGEKIFIQYSSEAHSEEGSH